MIGSVYASTWDDTRTITRYPINPDGTVGSPNTLLSEPADQVTFPGVLDGIGSTAITGSFSEYWTTKVQLRDATSGEVTSEVDAPDWCGGEGLTYNACVQLDDTRIARTSRLGEEGVQDSTITVSSLQTGETLAELGPFPGLVNLFGTTDPNTVMILIADTPNTDPPEPRSGTVNTLDLTSGKTTEVGKHSDSWSPMCAIGTDSMLGYTMDDPPAAEVVGPATIGEATWSEDDTPVGCTSDGKYVYVQHIPQPPGGESQDDEDSEPPNPATTLDRISLTDGQRTAVLTLDSGVYAELISR